MFEGLVRVENGHLQALRCPLGLLLQDSKFRREREKQVNRVSNLQEIPS